jgi:hypothetical protein
MLKDWLGLPFSKKVEWVAFQDIKSWWLHIVHAHPGIRKALATFVMLHAFYSNIKQTQC